MNVLPGKTTAILLSSAALFTAGLWLGHRLTRDHYQGIIARQALRFTEERRKLNEAAAQAWIDAERKVLSAERQKEKELSKIDRNFNMPKLRMRVLWLIWIPLAACTSVSGPPLAVVADCPQLPPPPASIMIPREPNFQSRLLDFLSSSPSSPIRPSAN